MMNKVDWNRVGSITDTSLKVASPGIVAAGLIGGPLAALGAAGAVVGGNVIGNALYDKVMQIKDERARRKAFKELQEHVLAENGILEYPGSNVQVPFAASERDFNAPALAQIAKGLAGSAQYATGVIGSAGLGANVVALNAVLRKPISIAKEKADDVVESTAVGRAGKKVVKEVGNAVSPVFVRKNYSEGKSFSEDSLISVSDEDILRMASCIECTPDSEKKLAEDRYLSMLDGDSREKLIEELDKRKAKDEPCPCSEPIVFSESPNLQTIAKGRDFGILTSLGAALKPLTKAAKVAGNVAKNTALREKAMTNAVSAATKTATEGGALSKIAKGIGSVGAKVKEGFTGEAVKTAVDTGKNVAENTSNITTKLSQIDPSNMNKFELKGVKMAGNSKLAASIGEKIGYENLGRGMKAVEAGAAQQAAETQRKINAEKQKNNQVQ